MMTWGEFKEAVEATGGEAFTDDSVIAYIDVSGFNVDILRVLQGVEDDEWRIA